MSRDDAFTVGPDVTRTANDMPQAPLSKGTGRPCETRRMRTSARTLAAVLSTVAVLSACSTDDDEVAIATTAAMVETSAATTTATSTTLAPATTEAPTTAEAPATTEAPVITEAPTTTVDPNAALVAKFVRLYTADRNGEARALTAPGSPAFTYLDGVFALGQGVDGIAPWDNATDNGDGSFTFRLGPDSLTLGGFVLADGLITDLERQGIPISRTVIASGAAFEAAGVSGTVHSFRYFDGNFQVIVTTVNNGVDEAEVRFDDYVTGGRQFNNVFGNSIRPTVTNTVLTVFEGAPAGEGTLYGNIWIGNVSEQEIQLPVPPIGL
jgi:hypothetical protein